MKIEAMHLDNFRQFYGKQNINFSRDPEQNVTVIHGVNGAGKTSLFTALNWCLYGQGADEIGELVSKRAIAEAMPGEELEMNVQLMFLHEGQRYMATRAFCVVKAAENQWREKATPEFSLYSVRYDGQTQPHQNPTGVIESILPSNVRTYFFFDGEKIDQFTRPSHQREVKEAIRNVLKIEVLDRAKNHLNNVARDYQNDLKRMSSGGLEQLLEKETHLRDEMEKTQSRLQELGEERGSAQRQVKEIDNRLGEIQEIREWDEKRKIAVQAMDGYERQMDQLRRDLKETTNRGFLHLADGAVSTAIDVLDGMRERGEIPPGIREQFVQDLLMNHRCICGRSLEDESEEHRRLLALLETSVPSELENVVLQTAGDLKAIQPRVAAVTVDIKELMARKAKIEDKLEEIHAELDEVSRHLQGSSFEEVADLEKKRAAYEIEIVRLATEIGRFSERLESQRGELDQLNRDIDRATVSEKRAQITQRRYSIARTASDAIESMSDAFAQEMRASIQAEAEDIFQRLVWKESQFQSVRLNEDYYLDVIDRWGLPARPDLSAGERQVLSLAFITGMSKVTGEEAPLVMDTPFGRLSSAHREAITEHIPEITDQLVILVTDEELRDMARENLEPRIGAEYNLRFDQETGCTEIVGLTAVR